MFDRLQARDVSVLVVVVSDVELQHVLSALPPALLEKVRECSSRSPSS